jgi:CHAD domain-containing protein
VAYAFDPADKDLDASLRRIVDEELHAAVARLDRIDTPEAVHGIRKNLKKTRALLRLVRTGLAVQPAANLALRDVGLALSARRDAEVRLATLDRLFPDPPSVLGAFRDSLLTEGQTPQPGPSPALAETLRALRHSARDWTLAGKHDRILCDGLATTRRKARKATRAARKTPGSSDLVHTWRKRVKDHWYQARLIAPAWPELFRPILATADRLGEALGQHHDLASLSAHASGLPDSVLPDQARALLVAQLQQAQTRIMDQAFPLADRLFAGNPEDVAALWLDWLQVWRRAAG